MHHYVKMFAVLVGLTRLAESLPAELSADNDLFNQAVLVEHFSQAYYKDRFAGTLPLEQYDELYELVALARQHPVLALAAAQVLYMFGWYERQPAQPSVSAGSVKQSSATSVCGRTLESLEGGSVVPDVFGPLIQEALRLCGGVDLNNAAAAAEFFEVSIAYSGCAKSSLTLKQFVDELACDIRWSHALVLNEYLAQAHASLGDMASALSYENKASGLLAGLLQTPRFRGPCCAHWTQPLDFNFNAVFFPEVPSAPVWSRSAALREKEPPLASFLRQSYAELRSELEPLLGLPKEAWISKAPGVVNAEHLASPEGWHMLAIVRHGEWNTLLCQMAPRTCELLGSRPEIQNCTVANSNIMRLSPGGMVKPHFGNAPRLSAHLSLIAPEPDAAVMHVGVERVQWTEGEVIIFDDTYVHYVGSHGSLPRYVLNVWFCHPCDTNSVHSHGQECIV